MSLTFLFSDVTIGCPGPHLLFAFIHLKQALWFISSRSFSYKCQKHTHPHTNARIHTRIHSQTSFSLFTSATDVFNPKFLTGIIARHLEGTLCACLNSWSQYLLGKITIILFPVQFLCLPPLPSSHPFRPTWSKASLFIPPLELSRRRKKMIRKAETVLYE